MNNNNENYNNNNQDWNSVNRNYIDTHTNDTNTNDTNSEYCIHEPWNIPYNHKVCKYYDIRGKDILEDTDVSRWVITKEWRTESDRPITERCFVEQKPGQIYVREESGSVSGWLEPVNPYVRAFDEQIQEAVHEHSDLLDEMGIIHEPDLMQFNYNATDFVLGCSFPGSTEGYRKAAVLMSAYSETFNKDLAERINFHYKFVKEQLEGSPGLTAFDQLRNLICEKYELNPENIEEYGELVSSIAIEVAEKYKNDPDGEKDDFTKKVYELVSAKNNDNKVTEEETFSRFTDMVYGKYTEIIVDAYDDDIIYVVDTLNPFETEEENIEWLTSFFFEDSSEVNDHEYQDDIDYTNNVMDLTDHVNDNSSNILDVNSDSNDVNSDSNDVNSDSNDVNSDSNDINSDSDITDSDSNDKNIDYYYNTDNIESESSKMGLKRNISEVDDVEDKTESKKREIEKDNPFETEEENNNWLTSFFIGNSPDRNDPNYQDTRDYYPESEDPPSLGETAGEE